MSKIAAWAHERDSQAAFVSEPGVPAHKRDSQAAFVSETGVPAHERDSRAAFRLLIVRMVLKIAAAAKLLAAAAYGMVTGLGAKIHAPCPVSKEHYFLK